MVMVDIHSLPPPDPEGRFNQSLQKYFGQSTRAAEPAAQIGSIPYDPQGRTEEEKALDLIEEKKSRAIAQIENQIRLIGRQSEAEKKASEQRILNIEKESAAEKKALETRQRRERENSAFRGQAISSLSYTPAGEAVKATYKRLDPAPESQPNAASDNANKTTQQQSAHHQITNLLKNPSIGGAISMFTKPVADYYGKLQGVDTGVPLHGAGVARAARLGALGAAGLAGFEALPYALGGIERFYGRTVGSDLAYGQSAGFQGRQGAGAFGTGLINKYALEPLNLLSSFTGMGQIPFMGSEAQTYGSQQRLEAFKAGFNPFDALSISDAEGIQREVLNRGYRAKSQTSKDVVKGLEDLKNVTNIDPGQALDYIDLFVKKLGVSVESVIGDLRTFASASRAAGKSIDQYTKEVSAVAKDLINANVNPYVAKAVAAGAAGIEGVSAEQMSSLTNKPNAFLIQQAMKTNPDIFKSAARTMQFLQNPSHALGISTTEGGYNTVKAGMDQMKMMYPGQPLGVLADIAPGIIPDLAGLDGKAIMKILQNGPGDINNTKRSAALSPLTAAFTEYQKAKTPDYGGTLGIGMNMTPKQKASEAILGSHLDTLYARYNKFVQSNPDLNQEQKDKLAKMIKDRDNPDVIEQTVGKYLGTARGDKLQAQDQKYILEASPELKPFFRLLKENPRYNAAKPEGLRNGTPRNTPNPSDRTALGVALGWSSGG